MSELYQFPIHPYWALIMESTPNRRAPAGNFEVNNIIPTISKYVALSLVLLLSIVLNRCNIV